MRFVSWLLVAGAIFGDVGVSLLVVGASFGDVGVSLFMAGALFGDVGVSLSVARLTWRCWNVTFRSRCNTC